MSSVRFLLLVLIPCIAGYKINSNQMKPLSNSLIQQKTVTWPKNEFARHVHSMADAFNEDSNGKVLIETKALINTKYQALKRNGDFINSLLGFPKGLSDAGR